MPNTMWMATFLSWWSLSDSDLSLSSPIWFGGTSGLLAFVDSILTLGHAQIDSVDFSGCRSSYQRFIIHDTLYQKQSIIYYE